MCIFALLAQWLEQPAHNRLVVGSNPAGGTIGPSGGMADAGDLKSFAMCVRVRIPPRAPKPLSSNWLGD